MEIEFAPHIEEIKRALDNEIDDDSILADLKKLLQYRVPIEEAKRSLVKKYGGAEKSIVRKLKDIEIGDRNIEVIAQVIEIAKKNINIKGAEKTIFSGIIKDETAARSFTAWHDFALNAGDVINITQAYVRNWQDRPEVNIGPRSKVAKLSTGIAITQESQQKKLSELRDGEVNVHTVLTILSIETREISTKDGTRKILSGIGADDETKLPFTAWVILPELEVGNTVEVKNAYVRSFRGLPTIHINENSAVTKLDKKVQYNNEKQKITIGNLIEKEGAFDVVIEGNILSVRPGSGLIARCPECSRVIQKSICRVHGKVDEKMDMRIKAIIDDGTGALTLVLNAELTHQICGFTIEQSKQIAKAAMSQNAVEEEIRKKLLGKMLTAKGNMSKGEYGITLVASSIWMSPDVTKEKAAELLEKAG
ncbi:MAG: Single-stranded DNA binding protein [Candidatus Methanoperedens sp.]|nr:Single-stranded DNA binding protein [Candidatus Methanoperedens sp.]MCZ7369946.1 Single-stranded DNA binding protein [Candidatus Methanoperedens sp.]